MTDDRKIADLTVAEFMELLISTDEREILKAKVKEYDAKIQEAQTAMARSKELYAQFPVNTVSTPFAIKSVEELDTWVGGLRVALHNKSVSEIVLCMATKL